MWTKLWFNLKFGLRSHTPSWTLENASGTCSTKNSLMNFLSGLQYHGKWASSSLSGIDSRRSDSPRFTTSQVSGWASLLPTLVAFPSTAFPRQRPLPRPCPRPLPLPTPLSTDLLAQRTRPPRPHGSMSSSSPNSANISSSTCTDFFFIYIFFIFIVPSLFSVVAAVVATVSLTLRRIPRLAFSYWTILVKQIKSSVCDLPGEVFFCGVAVKVCQHFSLSLSLPPPPPLSFSPPPLPPSLPLSLPHSLFLNGFLIISMSTDIHVLNERLIKLIFCSPNWQSSIQPLKNFQQFFFLNRKRPLEFTGELQFFLTVLSGWSSEIGGHCLVLSSFHKPWSL